MQPLMNTPLPETFTWLKWSYAELHMPQEMHTDSTSLIRLLQYMQTWRKGIKTLVSDHRRLEELLLVSGMLLRDTNTMYFPHDADDVVPSCPEYVNSNTSQLDLEILSKITGLLKQVADSIISDTRREQPKTKKPAPRRPPHPKSQTRTVSGNYSFSLTENKEANVILLDVSQGAVPTETTTKRNAEDLQASPGSSSEHPPAMKRARSGDHDDTADDRRRTARQSVPTKRFDGLEGTRPPLSKGKKGGRRNGGQ